MRYNEVREVWEAANEEQIGSFWDGDLFDVLDSYVEGGRDAVRMKLERKEQSERKVRANRNKGRATQRYKNKAAKLKEEEKKAERERKKVA